MIYNHHRLAFLGQVDPHNGVILPDQLAQRRQLVVQRRAPRVNFLVALDMVPPWSRWCRFENTTLAGEGPLFQAIRVANRKSTGGAGYPPPPPDPHPTAIATTTPQPYGLTPLIRGSRPFSTVLLTPAGAVEQPADQSLDAPQRPPQAARRPTIGGTPMAIPEQIPAVIIVTAWRTGR